MEKYDELIRAFYLTWDAFPGTARLIDKGNHMLSTQTAQIDRPIPEKIRAWVPIDGYPDVVVHFSVMLPECDQK